MGGTASRGWSWQPVFDDYDLWSVLAGRVNAALRGVKVRFGAGSMFVLRSGDSEIRCSYSGRVR
jgi:hypothetical protein